MSIEFEVIKTPLNNILARTHDPPLRGKRASHCVTTTTFQGKQLKFTLDSSEH